MHAFRTARRTAVCLAILASVQILGAGVAGARAKPVRTADPIFTEYQGQTAPTPAKPPSSGDEQFWHLGF